MNFIKKYKKNTKKPQFLLKISKNHEISAKFSKNSKNFKFLLKIRKKEKR
jgi:hypothetical protein